MNSLARQLPKWDTLPDHPPTLLTLMEFAFLPVIPGMLGGMIVGFTSSIFIAAATAKTIGLITAACFTVATFVGLILYTRRELNRTVDIEHRLILDSVVHRLEDSSDAVLLVRAVDQYGHSYCQREFKVGDDVEASEYATQLQEAISQAYTAYMDRQIEQRTQQDAAVAELEGTQRALSAAL